MRYLFSTITAALILSVSVSAYCQSPAMDKAWTYYLKSDYKRALDECRSVSRDRALGEEGRYLMGLSFLKLGRQKQAQENFEFVLRNYPGTGLKQELLLGLADSYFLQGNFGKAEEYYKKLIKNFSPTDYASIAYLNLGRAQRRLGKWKQSKEAFYKVTYDYPLSLEAGEAKRYLAKNCYFSVQAGAFAKRENALNLLELLRSKGYQARLDKQYDKDSIFYKVKIGRFDKKQQADKESARLKADGFSARVVS